MSRVLIVEDDEGIADFLRLELEHRGTAFYTLVTEELRLSFLNATVPILSCLTLCCLN